MNPIAKTSDIGPSVLQLQEALAQMPPVAEMPTTHLFTDGMYARQIVIPPQTCIVSKTHRKACFFILLEGDLSVRTDEALVHLVAGQLLVAPPGKRAVVSVGGCRALTVHRLESETEDLDEIEAQLITPETFLSRYDMNNQLKGPETLALE